MLIGLITQLLDACLGCGRPSPEPAQPSRLDLVEPIYQLAQQVHEQYLMNFKEYQATLGGPGAFSAKAEALCLRLDADHRFSRDQEAKAVLLMDISRQQGASYVREELLNGLITSICSYLGRAFTEVYGTQYSGGTLHVASPVFRNTLTGRLRKMAAEAALSEAGKQAAGAEVLDSIVAELQSGFAGVTKRYLALRTKMTG